MLESSNTMVGQALKVWWPKHQKYAHGTVQSFDSTTFRHNVVYEDGNEEYLWLAIESYIPLGKCLRQNRMFLHTRQFTSTHHQPDGHVNQLVKAIFGIPALQHLGCIAYNFLIVHTAAGQLPCPAGSWHSSINETLDT